MIYHTENDTSVNVSGALRRLYVGDSAIFYYLHFQGVQTAIARLQRQGHGRYTRETSEDKTTIKVTRTA